MPEAPPMVVQHVPNPLGALDQSPPFRRVTATAISLHARQHSPSHPRARHLPPRRLPIASVTTSVPASATPLTRVLVRVAVLPQDDVRLVG